MSGKRSWYAIRQKAVANLKPTQNFMQKSCNFSLTSYFKKKLFPPKQCCKKVLNVILVLGVRATNKKLF